VAADGLGFTVFDVETTGLYAVHHRIVEIAVVRTDSRGRIVDEWATLLNPGASVGPTHIHGITNADIRRAPRFADVAGELAARLSGRALVAHNAPFDLAFLRLEFARAGFELPAAPYLCTLAASRIYLPDLSRRRLVDCCQAAGVDLYDAHSALGDARATALLLAHYLRPGASQPAEHRELPARARSLAWPPLPTGRTAPTVRGPRPPAPTPAEPGRLAVLLDELPLSSAEENGSPAGAMAYLELLAEVFADAVLTEDEAVSVAELAKLYGLTRDQIEAAHRGFLLALAHHAVSDGKVTWAERDELLAVATALSFPTELIRSIVEEARHELARERAKDCLPLPDGWTHGEPLRLGDGVAFTGCDDLERARLEGRAVAAGLRVTGGVSVRTAVLVTDGANPHTVKARAARDLGTRVVEPATFAALVEYVQPALP
jgi:DNA polymerase-3 subunit epsilon